MGVVSHLELADACSRRLGVLMAAPPTGARIQIEGLQKTVREMQRLGIEVEDLKATFTKVGAAGVMRAQGLAPKRSGKLAGSIRQSRRKNSVILKAGNNRKSASGVPYAGPIHWGWPKRNIEANPWMWNMADGLEPQFMRWLEAELNSLIRKHRLGRKF